jgi:anaerobic dimethyl sulfoxide reductase subunit A
MDMPRLVPCLRGRARKRLLNARERVLKPLKRLGPRGSKQFREVTWDEALDEVADQLAAVRDRYDTEAVLHIIGYGSIGGRGFSGASASGRFFSYWGSVTGTHGNPSSWCAGIADNWMLGRAGASIHSGELLESRLIILWGMNPAENRHGVDLAYYVSQARDRGARVILIDPRYTDSGILADQWIPIKPGTDVALIAAIAHIWESKGVFDADFMSTYTVGYNTYRSYLLGESDGVPKTSEWAAKITGVSADTIRELAHEYASVKPAVLLAGLGPQRSRYGEQVERALITLACMSGNVGIRGGGITHGGRHPGTHIMVGHLPQGPHRPTRNLKVENWAKDILDDSLRPPVRMAYIVATNAINRSSNTRANASALEQLEYVVVNDEFFTPTARYADIVFPICTDLERGDLVGGQGAVHYGRRAVTPMGESRTDYWVFARLAERLGFEEDYTGGKTEAEWLEHFLTAGDLDVDVLQRDGIIRSQGTPPTRLARFREDPKAHPLDTPSGLIQITCTQAEEYDLPIIPSYMEGSWDGSSDYPLRLLTPHSKLRANSSGYANAWLQSLEPHRVWINAQDARERGIAQGELVEVFNQYGTVAIPAKVTERIMPGVVCVYQGVWYRPGSDGVDEGGCANVLTGHHLSPTGGMAVHSEWVEVRRREP